MNVICMYSVYLYVVIFILLVLSRKNTRLLCSQAALVSIIGNAPEMLRAFIHRSFRRFLVIAPGSLFSPLLFRYLYYRETFNRKCVTVFPTPDSLSL